MARQIDCRCSYCTHNWSVVGRPIFFFTQRDRNPRSDIVGTICPKCKSSGYMAVVE